ncbi:MAG: hypothetical protein DDT26_01846 [Dehalococcoidia bacterium]|nr:hypothetical protein [Chloroflexota bacterium]
MIVCRYGKPVFDYGALTELLTRTANGNLNQIVSSGKPIVGIHGAVASGRGMRSLTLCQQFTEAEVVRALLTLPTELRKLLVLVYWFTVGIDGLAIAIEVDSDEALDKLMHAQELFLKVLYAQSY